MQKIEKRHKFRVGMHTSIAGGVAKSVERAMALNCNTLQIFSHNPRQWRVNPIPGEEPELFAILRKKYDIRPAYIHASYLINLASLSICGVKIFIIDKSKKDMEKKRINYNICYTHPGHDVGYQWATSC